MKQGKYMNTHIAPVPLAKSHRLIHHGPDAEPAWRSLHYIAGGHSYATGDALPVQEGAP